MKKLLFTLVALFAIASAQAQEAFYIYQNDGHFDGFFYDEVEKISYSRLDTLGIEHSDYVSQEIVTPDSTYRIMLTAIDSVSFVQPPIRYNPRLRNMREEGMLDFLTSKDEETMTLTFSSSMPGSLRPKVGDVLVDFDLDELFGGKVKSVNTAGEVTVVCDHLEGVHDIYEQYVTVEQYGKDEKGALVRRRVAGMPELNVGNFPVKVRHKSEGEYEFNIFNFSLSGHYPVYTSPEGDVNISIDADINVAIDVKAVWDFPMFGPDYLSVTTTLNNDIGLGFTLDGKINDIYPLGLVPGGGFPIPANCPLFIIDFGPDIFAGGEYHAKLSFQTPKFKGKLWGRLELAGDFSSPRITFGRGTPPGEQAPDPVKEAEENTWSGSLEFNGYEQCGVMTHFSFGASKLLSWALKTNVEFTTYIGPKVTGALNLSLSNVMQDQMSVYNLLKDTKLTFSPLGASYEAKATMKTLFTQEREWTLADGSYNLLGDIDLFLFPSFEVEGTADKDGNYGKVTASVTPSGNVIFPVAVGVGLYKDDELCAGLLSNDPWIANGRMPVYSQFDKVWKEKKSFTYDMKYLEGGDYELRPTFSFLGSDPLPGSPAKKLTVSGPMFEMQDRTFNFNSKGGSITASYKTNCKNLKFEASYDASTEGAKQFNIDVNDDNVTLSVGKLHGLFARFTDYTVRGEYAEDESATPAYLRKGAYFTVRQDPDGQYNRIYTNGLFSSHKVECSTDGHTSVLSAHKSAEEIDGYPPADEYDISMTIVPTTNPNHIRQGFEVPKFSLKHKGPWWSAGNGKIEQFTIEMHGSNGWLFNKDIQDNGFSWVYFYSLDENGNESTSITRTITHTYAVWNEDEERYVITTSETEDDSEGAAYGAVWICFEEE